jgi:hypothetical protein
VAGVSKFSVIHLRVTPKPAEKAFGSAFAFVIRHEEKKKSPMDLRRFDNYPSFLLG